MREPHLAEQFEDLGKQVHAYRLGMWVFLASEALLFAGLFALYGAYRVMYPMEFAAGVAHNDVVIGSTNTCVLITSSLAVALGVHEVRADRPRRAGLLMGFAVLLGGVFLTLKGLEYSHHIEEGIVPGIEYHFQALPGFGHKMFFTLYYMTTGLHAIHVIGGMCILAWLAVQCLRRGYSSASHVPVELGALYWHLVDIVWIFLWPLLYLAK